MKDIYQVFIEMEPTDTTTFVAQNLSNLPPLTMDNKDTLRLLKEVENVKSELNSMQIAQAGVTEIVNMNMKSIATQQSTNNANNKVTSDQSMIKSTLVVKHNKDNNNEVNKDGDKGGDEVDNCSDDNVGKEKIAYKNDEIPAAQPQDSRIISDNNVPMINTCRN